MSLKIVDFDYIFQRNRNWIFFRLFEIQLHLDLIECVCCCNFSCVR